MKELLTTLGFSVIQYAARFYNTDGSIQIRRHQILVVSLGAQRYLINVGVRNESPRKALRLCSGQIQSDGICEYRFEKDVFFGWMLLQKEHGKDWAVIYGFTEEPQLDLDYILPSFYCEKHPESTFNKYMKLSIFSGDSNYTIVDGIFQEYRNAKVQFRKHLTNRPEICKILKQYFNLENLPYIPLR